MSNVGPPAEEPQVLAFACPTCERPQTMRIVSRHVRATEETDPTEYTYLVCSRCSSPLLLSRLFDFSPEGFDGSPYQREYPVQRRKLSFALPPLVSHSYEEAVRCEEAKLWTATAVMVGRALEATCREFDPASKGIGDGLRRMLTAGAISQELYDWGEGLRVVRNEGAHAGTRVHPRDATNALDFLQALVDILFDLRERFAEWQREREHRSARRTRGDAGTQG